MTVWGLSIKYYFCIMSGIYIHIPFCKRKCIYCDFYSVAVSEEKLDAYLDALVKEYRVRKAELGGSAVRTLYIGGGTPSLVPAENLGGLLHGLCDVAELEEVTIEVNPDDVTPVYARALAEIGVNRVSMGVQSFDDGQLAMLNRRHSGAQAAEAVATLRQAGFSNISIDLIYGIPGQTLESWAQTVGKAVALDVPHISAYSLTYEEGTRLTRMRDAGKLQECSDEQTVAMFDLLGRVLTEAGYEQYEISNFAKPGMYSRHNSSYWNFTPYIGLGASAHSFDGRMRRYNPSDLRGYMAAVGERGYAYEEEQETADELYNEWVMTRLRTVWGLDLANLRSRFGNRRADYAEKVLARFVDSEDVAIENGVARLTHRGIMVSDMIFRDLFLV